MSYEIITVNPGQQIFPVQYVQEEGQAIFAREPCPEIYTLLAVNLPANTDSWLNLSSIGFSFLPLTVFWANRPNNQTQGNITLSVYDPTKTSIQANLTFNSVALQSGYSFPVMVIHAGNQIKINPGYAVDALYFWVKPCVAPAPLMVF